MSNFIDPKLHGKWYRSTGTWTLFLIQHPPVWEGGIMKMVQTIWLKTWLSFSHVEQRRQVANAKQPEAKAEETNESKSTTDETLKQQTDCALDAFHNNNYGSKVCHPPICHSHMEVSFGSVFTGYFFWDYVMRCYLIRRRKFFEKHRIELLHRVLESGFELFESPILSSILLPIL